MDNWLIDSVSKCKRNTVGALSRYDVEYLRYYTGLDPKLVPSFSGYYAGHYSGISPELLVFDKHYEKRVQALIDSLKPEFTAGYYRNMYHHFSLDDLGKHKAAIFLPYSVMCYKTTELYALTIPLFYPSPKFFLPHKGTRGFHFTVGVIL